MTRPLPHTENEDDVRTSSSPVLATRRAAVRFAPQAVTDAGEISGYGSIFGAVDTYGSIMMPGCFANSIARHKADGTMPKGLWQHDADFPILAWTAISEDEVGLRCDGRLILEVEKAREAHALAKANAIDGLSIGFEYVEKEDVSPEDAAARGLVLDASLVNPETGLFELVHDVDLWEISIVTFNSCPEALIDEVRAPRADAGHFDWAALSTALMHRGQRLRRL